MGCNAILISRQNAERSYSIKLFLVLLSCFACVALSGVEAHARGCTYIPDSGYESFHAWITNEYTGEEVEDGAVLPGGTPLRFDSIAEAYGSCYCPETGVTRYRTVHHTTVSADIWADGLGGHFTLGYVYGWDANGTAFWHVLDTFSPNTTGPVFYTPSRQGTYLFHVQAVFSSTPCNIQPARTKTVSTQITVY